MPLYSANDIQQVTSALSSTSNHTVVASAAVAGPILAANPSRLGATIFNRSTKTLYILLDDTGVVSATNFTVQVLANQYYELPFNYTGIVNGIWAAVNGDAQVEEFLA